MNGLDKSINELINMLVQYEATANKSVQAVLVEEASTSKTKGKRVGRWNKKKGKVKTKAAVAAKDDKSAPIAPVGMGKGKRKKDTQQQSRANDIRAHCHEKGHWKRIVPNFLPSNVCLLLRKLSKDEVVLRLGDGKAVTAEAVGTVNLVISDRVRLELKDCYFVPSIIKNIISIPLLDNASFEFLINKNYFYLMKDGSSHLLGKLNNGLYILQRIKRLVDSKSLEIDNLDNLQAYVCGLINTQARGGFSYFIIFIDDHSRYGYVYLMRYKYETFVRFKEFRLEVENQNPSIRLRWRVSKYGLDTISSMDDKPVSYKHLRVWGSPAYVKRLVKDKLDSRSSLCKFIGYLKETAGYYFYDPSEHKVFVSRNAVFLKRGFPEDTRCDELLLEESSEAPQSNVGTLSVPTVSTDNVPVLRRSARVPQPPERYGFLGVIGELDNDPKIYEEAKSDFGKVA
ncbi:UNVERIFIED_CONTAM: hypothetical protein Slati_2495100 [Sesamum latifolium]|uniref:Uncharacterized protein n=1 Tax=Sesamum latifolium TaxID=2727402 RepID=A0AAW2WFU4_9LAMI